MGSVPPRSASAGPVLAVIVVLLIAVSAHAHAARTTVAATGGHAGAPAARYGWSRAQTGNARLIVEVGREMGVPAYGLQIALATAMQESKLTNLAGGPDDSAGLFQQRPSQGWGTYAQVTTPRYAARRFYLALLAVPHWQRLSLYDAAQSVQRSCCPLLYQRWAPAARQLLESLSG